MKGIARDLPPSILIYRPMAPSVMTCNNQIPYMDFVGPVNMSNLPNVVSILVH